MSRWTLLLMLLSFTVWGGLVFVGYQGVQSIAQQHVPGYPTSGQVEYYVIAPLVILVIAAVWPLILKRSRAGIRNLGPAISLLILPLYLFPYTGGM